MGWLKISCADRDLLVDELGRSYNGPADPYGVISSLTDLCGQFGEPKIETVWGHKATEVPVLRDVRHPPRYEPTRDDYATQPDSRPCEHYRFEETP